jgi:hypothetical protein
MSSLGFSDRLQSAPFFYYFNLLSNFAQFSIVMKEYAYKNGIYPYQANSTGTSRDIQPWNLKHIIKVLSFTDVKVLSVIPPLRFFFFHQS